MLRNIRYTLYFSDREAFGGLLLFPPCDDDDVMYLHLLCMYNFEILCILYLDS